MAMGFSLLDHMAVMLGGVAYSAVILGGILPPKINLKQLLFSTVLMVSWYATQKLMAQIDQLAHAVLLPAQKNRRVDDSGGTAPCLRFDELVWNAQDFTTRQAHPQSFWGSLPQKSCEAIPYTCALLVWTRLKASAYNTGRTVYQIKYRMLSDYLIAQLRYPSVQMTLA